MKINAETLANMVIVYFFEEHGITVAGVDKMIARLSYALKIQHEADAARKIIFERIGDRIS